MCRLAAITSKDYISPMENILALETMKEGHDGSGLGLTLKDLGGHFDHLKAYPILSGICSKDGAKILDDFMDKAGFQLKDVWAPKIKAVKGIRPRDHYFARAYDYPFSFKYKPFKEKEDLLMNTRLALRKIGEVDESIFVFSFYPDVLTLKEVGDPLQVVVDLHHRHDQAEQGQRVKAGTDPQYRARPESIDQPSDPRILADDVDCLQNSLANASRGHRIVATYVLAKRLEVADGRPSELDLHSLAVSI